MSHLKRESKYDVKRVKTEGKTRGKESKERSAADSHGSPFNLRGSLFSPVDLDNESTIDAGNSLTKKRKFVMTDMKQAVIDISNNYEMVWTDVLKAFPDITSDRTKQE
jgi:hypothetical protein